MKMLMMILLLSLPMMMTEAKTKAKKNKPKKEVECALNFAEMHSMLDQKPEKFKVLEAEKSNKVDRIVSQVAVLKSGERLKFTSGGCAHFSYSFTYSELKKTKFKDVEEQKKYALELLEKTPSYDADLLVKAMKKTTTLTQKGKMGFYPLQCGDAECVLDLSLKDRIKISYSMAL